MRKIILTFGLISGFIMSVMLVVAIPFHDTLLENGGGLIVGYASMVAAALLIYFGVRRYRDTVAGGSVTFGRAFGVGLAIALIAGLCYTATWEVIYFGFDSDFAEQYSKTQLESARKAGATPAELEKKRLDGEKFAQMYKNPFYNFAMTFMEPLPVGLLGALVSAALLRRRSGGGTQAGLVRTA